MSLVAAFLYIVGALLVLAGAFLPVAARVHGTRDVAAKAEAADAAPTAWRWHNILMASGATVTVAAVLWEAIGPDRTALVAAAAAFALGAVFFVHFLVARATTPPGDWFDSRAGMRRFTAFTALTLAGLVLRGTAALQDGQQEGALLVAYGLLLLLAYAWKHDMPPFAHYVGTLAWGFTLLP